MAMFIVLLGPPGAGKGTQAKFLADHLDMPHISSGDLFRENLQAKTDMGKLAQTFMDRGDLVPDDVTIGMVRERLSRPDCVNGAVLDGFPRTPAQADALANILAKTGNKVSLVPYIAVPAPILIERLSGRWSCRTAGHVYHEKYNPSKVAGKCDFDGSDLYQRDDDKKETVSRRIQVYFEQTAPLIEYYNAQGLIVDIDGTQEIETVSHRLAETINRERK
jgi:adenylate kinase